jgi:hypothetical protein
MTFSALEITFQHLRGAVKEIGLFETKFQCGGFFTEGNWSL